MFSLFFLQFGLQYNYKQ